MSPSIDAPLKVVLLAGGLGTRLAEETEVLPKPMVEIGGHPIIWHIIQQYVHQGFKEFVVALGYKGEVIKRYFRDYCLVNNDLTVRMAGGVVSVHEGVVEDWVVHLVDTGLPSMTGGRLKRLQPWLDQGTFMLTYGDGVANIDLQALLAFHRGHGLTGTVTAVRPPARFGSINFDGDRVSGFSEKPQVGEGWINGGFMVFEPAVFQYLHDDASVLEVDGLERLAQDRQLAAYRHHDFWQCMDTLRDKRLLERLWQTNQAPWKVWR